MKNHPKLRVAMHTMAGFALGLLLMIAGSILTYHHGFKGPFYNIFTYAPNFILIAFSPIYLGLLFWFFGLKRKLLVTENEELTKMLSDQQVLKTAADQHLIVMANVLSHLNEGIIISDSEGKIQWVNEGFTNNNGYQLDEIVGMKVNKVLHGPLTDQEAAKHMIQKLTNGEAVVEELLTYHKNGSTVWLSTSVKPVLNDSGKITNFVAIHNNITHRKKREIAVETLYNEVANYKFALDQSAIVIIFNLDGKILHVNKKFCEINELEEHQLSGVGFKNISINNRDKKIVDPIWETLSSCKTWKGEFPDHSKNGRSYWVDTTIVPLLDKHGRPYQFLAIQQDITERKTLEYELIANKNKLQQAAKIAKLGSWETDENGVIVISAELRQLFKIPEDHVIANGDITKNIHPEDRDKVNLAIIHCKDTLQKVEVQYRYFINGHEHFMTANVNPALNDAGEYIGSFGTVQDITAAKKIAIALKKSEEEKAVVLNNTQAIICLHDMKGILLDINPAAEKMSGFSKNEVIGLNLKLIVTPEYQPDFDTYIQTINSKETASGNLQIFTKSGAKRVWLYQNTVYKNEGSEPYVIASAIDITEAMKAHNELEKQQQFIRQIIDNSPNNIFMMNEERQILLANRTFSNYYPYNETETPFAETLSHGEGDIFLGNANRLVELQDGETSRAEGSIINPSTNTPFWFSTINKCFKDKKGKKYILSYGMDITERHQVESDLMTANEMVERSLKVKEQFIANMSHEIRTPLNAVIGFTDLLSETHLTTQQVEFVEIVKTASNNLLALINNILDLSKIESSNLTLEQLPINVAKIITEVVKILAPKATTKGIQVHAEIDKALPINVIGDQLRLTQVMFNILGNAIKFTDTGTIDIECKLVKGPDKQKNYISFSIMDTGIGVPEEKQSEIFKRFTQANTDTSRLYGGTGLGLNIAKSIVDLYGGTLNMESNPGKGTVFSFILPFKKYVEPGNLSALTSLNNNDILSINAVKPIHILLAEDNMVNAMLATEVLSKKGFIIAHVVNGELALEAVQQNYYDLILMDIQMPVMNGINAALAIRQLTGSASQIPIIAMTAHSLHGEMQNCYSSGMNGYVSKPFKAVDLFHTIFEVVKKKGEFLPGQYP